MACNGVGIHTTKLPPPPPYLKLKPPNPQGFQCPLVLGFLTILSLL